MNDRNKYLTEAMGGGNVHINANGEIYAWLPEKDDKERDVRVRWPDFSTWQGFGKLWEWAQEHSWFDDLIIKQFYMDLEDMDADNIIQQDLIHPDYLANAVYEFLKGRES